MDATQVAALQAASNRLTTAQDEVDTATAALTAAERQHQHAVANLDPRDVVAAATRVTQAKVTTLLCQAELSEAVQAVNALMTKPKPFKHQGQAPTFDLEADRDSFNLWKTRWNLFIALSTIDEVIAPAAREKYKANLLLSSVSPETLNAIVNARLDDAAMADSTQIIKHLEERCNAGKNKHVWRHQFNICAQRPNLSIDNWLCELRELSRKCEFASCCHNCEPERMMERIICGLADHETRVKLMEVGDNLTLDQVISTCRTAEMSKRQAEQLQPGGTVQGIRHKSAYKENKQSRVTAAAAAAATPSTATSGATTCDKCGYELRPGVHNCPARGKACNRCTKLNHFSSVCKEKGKLGAIYVGQIASSETDTVAITITPNNGTAADVNTLPDTGSTLDAIPSSVYRHQFQNVKLQAGVNAETAIGNCIKSLGSFKASVDWKANDGISRPVEATVHVLQDLKQPVLSKLTQQKLGMIPREYPHARVHQVKANNRPSDRKRAADLANLMDKYSKVFDGICREMDCDPVHLTLRDGATPTQIRGHRNVAEPLMQMFHDELTSQIEQGLVRPVPPGAVTPFISGVVTMPKDSVSGGVRITVDFRELNKWLVGTIFPNNTPFEAVRSIPTGMNYFTMFDGLKGYHMVPLDEESMTLTTFSTPFGLFQYTRLPMGICHAGDSFSSRYHKVFGDLPIAICVEDMCAYAKTYEEMLALNEKIIKRADEHNVSFNKKKTIAAFAVPEGDFAGFRLDNEGYRPSPELTRAIAEFPRPTDKTDLRSFNGLCQQVGLFSDQISTALAPFAPLLKKQEAFVWLPEHDKAFVAARRLLSCVPASAYYDATRPTTLFTDASRLRGLGFILKQQQADGRWRMVQAGSRFIDPTESRYAMIELELLGAAWAMKKCKAFLEGLPLFEVVLDHRPLIPILNDYSLDQLDNQRIIRLRLKMTRYCFRARWVPGKENIEADALSRSPVDQPTAADLLGEGPSSYTARTAVVGMIAEWAGSKEKTTDAILDSIKEAAENDPVLQKLRTVILEGFPNEKTNLPLELRPFWDKRDSLAIDSEDDMIVCGARVVVPRSKVHEMLNALLQMHQGASKMRQRARLSVYWPGMDVDIANAAKNCESCTSRLPSHPAEPMRPHEPAKRPFEQLHADLGEDDNRHFLVIVDAFSGWPQVTMFRDKNTTAWRLSNAFRDFFSTFGAPIRLWTDNQPFKAAEFQDFLQSYGVTWGSCSPHYQQSNGRAEAEVKTMKTLVHGAKVGGKWNEDKMARALLLFRNTPRCGGGPSPAESVFGRLIRDALPCHARAFSKEWQRPEEELQHRTEAARGRSEAFYNATAHTLAALSVGDHVLIQDPKTQLWTTKGTVLEVGPNRDYLIRTASGTELRRNRRHLRHRTPVILTKQPATQQRPTTYAEAAGGSRSQQTTPAAAETVPAPPTAEADAQGTPPEAADPPEQQPRHVHFQDGPPARRPIRQSNRTRGPPRYDVNNPNSEWTT